MGEIAEMMLDGTLCEGCGEFIGEPCEFPRLCAGCAKDRVLAKPQRRLQRLVIRPTEKRNE